MIKFSILEKVRAPSRIAFFEGLWLRAMSGGTQRVTKKKIQLNAANRNMAYRTCCI